MSAPAASTAPSRPLTGRQRPARVVDVELARPLEPIAAELPDGRRYDEAWLVVHLFEEPIGLVPVSLAGGRADVRAQAAAVRHACGDLVGERARLAGVPAAPLLAGTGVELAGEAPFLRRHRAVRPDGPEITVVLCTRNRPDDLRRALASLERQSYPRFGVLVVDNAPSDERTAELVTQYAGSARRVQYVREPRPGLSWARNRALTEVATPVVAWLDDDEEADRHWLAEIACAFAENPRAVAVSGSVVPAELETQPQLWFEQYGGHTKGRGFRPADFHGPDPDGQSALYPLPSFGVGANMAFAKDALVAVGGFDPALGAGTATLGGEDTLVFTQLLLRGGLVLYRPSALTRHYHRPDYDALARQMTGYGVGLTAYYASLLRSDWRLAVPLLRLAPRALRDTFGPGGRRLSGVPDSFPAELLRRKTRGMLAGPFAYLRARRRARALGGGRS